MGSTKFCAPLKFGGGVTYYQSGEEKDIGIQKFNIPIQEIVPKNGTPYLIIKKK